MPRMLDDWLDFASGLRPVGTIKIEGYFDDEQPSLPNPVTATVDGSKVTRHDGRGFPRKVKKAIRKSIAGRKLGRKERSRAWYVLTFPADAVTFNLPDSSR